MSRAFSSVSDYLSNSNPAATGYPCTISVWFKNNALTTQQALCSLGTSGGTNNNAMLLQTTGTGECQMTINAGSSGNQATSTTVVGDANWHLYTAIFTSPTNYSVYLDAGSFGTQTVAHSPSAFNIMRAAQWLDATAPIVSAGELAHIAVWNIALTSGNVTNLLTTPPSGVQPTNLFGYWTLCDNSSPEPDLGLGGHSLTVTGTTYVNDNPYVVTPSSNHNGLLLVGVG
jgi:hypothetical protein